MTLLRRRKLPSSTPEVTPQWGKYIATMRDGSEVTFYAWDHAVRQVGRVNADWISAAQRDEPGSARVRLNLAHVLAIREVETR